MPPHIPNHKINKKKRLSFVDELLNLIITGDSRFIACKMYVIQMAFDKYFDYEVMLLADIIV